MSTITDGSLALFLSLAEDAGNWSGTPLVTVNAQGRGHLTHLKKLDLLDTMQDEDGCVFAFFTKAGVALAAEHGVDLSWIEF